MSPFSEAELAARDRLEELARSSPGMRPDNRAGVRLYFAAILEHLGIPRGKWGKIEIALLMESTRGNLWDYRMPGVVEVLDELKRRGYPMGVVSNSDGRVAKLLAHTGIAHYFGFVVDSTVVGIEKPDPRIFRIAIDKFALPPAEIVFVGDIYEIDAVGARAAGMQPVLLDPRGTTNGRDCVVIRQLSELPALLT